MYALSVVHYIFYAVIDIKSKMEKNDGKFVKFQIAVQTIFFF